MKWILTEPCKSIFITAESDAIYIQGVKYDIASQNTLFPEPLTPLGQRLPTLIPLLLEQGYASIEDQLLKIPYDQFVLLSGNGISDFDDLTPWAPFFIELSTTGILGLSDFRYRLHFYNGTNRIAPERQGCFVKYLETIYRLDYQTYSLTSKIEHFRKLSPESKSSTESLIHFSTIRGLAEGVGAQIDLFIKENKVLIPPRLGIDLIQEGNGRISFAPIVDGLPQDALRQLFLQTEDVTTLHVEDGKGGRIRIIFSSEQQEALQRMAKIRHLGGPEKIMVLREPQAVFDGVAGTIDLDMGNFGPRVKGIGDFPFIAQPILQRSNTGIFDDPDFEGMRPEKGDLSRLNAGILCRYADGTEETVPFRCRDELIKFNHQVQNAYQQGTGTVEIDGKSIVVERNFAHGIKGLVDRLTQKSQADFLKEKKYLLIYENNDEIEYEEKWAIEKINKSRPIIPKSLISDVSLKPHQLEGLRWLQINYLMEGKNGCLLADDMGLGKTLQVLTFIAWLIEKEEISPKESTNAEAAPWNPILIVAPVILLENETWIKDMKKFFINDGDIFKPWCILHGQGVKEMRLAGASGQETKVQQPLLNLENLRQHRVIFTNYETIVNYQFSFASLKPGWSVVITDEAQAQKTPKTKISHALKSLAPRFRIACTGTPVETRLLDVWNIMDYIQPGELLGSASSFTKTYEQPLNDKPEQMEIILGSLRERLCFGKPSAFILRRDKTQELQGLPSKQEHKIECDLSPEQRNRHIEYIIRAKKKGEGNHPFTLIHGLMKLYQHPALVPRYEPFTAGNFQIMLDRCPKLVSFLSILREIKGKGEKALVFTRSIDMQQLLASSIYEAFGQRVDIINGTAQRNETGTSAKTRKTMVKHFQEKKNQNFIILSPDVAGIGLTLVEANHVIHYGRWWNPAKESQATDRVHRIGQERDVHVYYLIAKDPQGQFKSFDEKLDALIDRRRKMAKDFLAPMPGEQELQGELYKDIFEDPPPSEGGTPISMPGVRLLPWDRFEALIAVLEQRMGRRVFLTPQSGDMGIDVVSLQDNSVRLIQCKHRRYGGEIESDIISEMLHAFDTYRSHFINNLKYKLKPVLVTNGHMTSSILEQCKNHDIELIAEKALDGLLKQYPCTIPDVEFMEAARLESMKQFKVLFQ